MTLNGIAPAYDLTTHPSSP